MNQELESLMRVHGECQRGQHAFPGWRIYFQDGSFPGCWLDALSTELLKCPDNKTAGFPQSEWSKRKSKEKAALPL